MSPLRLWLLSLWLFAAGCTCGAYDPNTRFVCVTDDDCGAGSACARVQGELECIPIGNGGAGGGGAAGGGSGGAPCTTDAGCADPADRLQITTLVTDMLRYECRGPFQVELRNVNGVRTAIRDTPRPVAMTSSQFSFSLAPDCMSAGTGLMINIADGSAATAAFYVTATAAGGATLTATLGAITGSASSSVN